MDIRPPQSQPPRRPAKLAPDVAAAVNEIDRQEGQGIDPATVPADESAPVSGQDKKRRWYKRIGWWWLVIVLLVICAAGSVAWYMLASVKPVETSVNHVQAPPKPPKPATVAAPLTGAQVSADAASQPIVGVMIENLDPDARPQSGLGAAGVVYEALAEGGITRFLALFQEPLPPVIGPVRSLRPYYLDWALEYNAPVAHAGGSIPALQNVAKTTGIDIDALRYDGSYFYRTKDRAAPHNLYTNNDLLSKLVQQLHYNRSPSFPPMPRKADTPPTGVVPHPSISINFSYSDYAVSYKYDATTNSYARFMAGTPHIDRNTGKQIMVKNVIVEYVPTSYTSQANGKPETDLALVGSGKALVFTDGNVTAATWSKSSDSAPTQLTDANGQPIKLNVGNTWFSVVPTTNTVTY